MPNKSIYNLVGFTLSIIIYIFFMLSLGIYLQDKIQKNISYTTKKNSVLDITLVEQKSNKLLKVKKKNVKKMKQPKAKKVFSKPKAKNVESKSEKTVSLQRLFKKIDTKKIQEPKKQKTIQSRKNIISPKVATKQPITKENAKKIVDSLTFINQDNNSSIKDGIYDKIRGKIYQILNTNWQNTIDTVSGNSAIVTVFIDKSGNFSYKIEKLLGNDAFNSKLIDFLERMKDKEFPLFTGKGVLKMRIEFKDIRND